MGPILIERTEGAGGAAHRFWEHGLRALTILALALWVVSLAGAAGRVGRPFAGFDYGQHLSVWLTTAPEWSGTKAGLMPTDEILSAAGRSMALAPELDRLVASSPVGTAITYTVTRRGQTRSVTIPTERFGWGDFALSSIPLLLVSLAFLLIAVVPFWLRPASVSAQACLLVGVAAGVSLALEADWGGARMFGTLIRHTTMWLSGAAILLPLAFPKPRSWLVRRPYLAALSLVPAIAFPRAVPWDAATASMTFSAFFLPGIGFLLVALAVTAARAPAGLDRARALIVLMAGCMAGIPTAAAGIALATMPANEVLPHLHRLTLLVIPVFPAAVAYAILKHRLFDIELLVKRTLVYSLVAAMLVTAYFLLAAGVRFMVEKTTHLSGTAAGNVLATALITVSFVPLTERVSGWIERLFFRAPYDFKEVISSFSEVAQATVEARELVDALLDHVDAALHPLYAAVLRLDEHGGPLAASRGEVRAELLGLPANETVWAQVASACGVVELDVPPGAPLAGALALPLRFRDELLGAVVVGPLRSDLSFTDQDRLLLVSLSRDVAVRLKSAQFVSNLETLVAQRTGELDQALARLQTAYSDLQELDKLKAAFMDTVTHELRTPITFILGFAHLLASAHEEELDPGSQREYAERVMSGARQLERLVDDLLDSARIESGQLSLDTQPLDLGELIEEVAATTKTLADQKEIRMDVRIEADLPFVVADSRRVTQIFNNLVSNAIKYTPEGGVVSIRASRDGDSLRTEIEDNGIGIPADAQMQLFSPFYRVDSSLRRTTKGLGLGLAITKSLVERHGGKIGLRSEPDRGSLFWFTLPLALATDSPLHVPSSRQADGDARIHSRIPGV